MTYKTDSHTADGKRGDDFMASLLTDIALTASNSMSPGNEAPWATVANYVANLERRVKAIEDEIAAKGL